MLCTSWRFLLESPLRNQCHRFLASSLPLLPQLDLKGGRERLTYSRTSGEEWVDDNYLWVPLTRNKRQWAAAPQLEQTKHPKWEPTSSSPFSTFFGAQLWKEYIVSMHHSYRARYLAWEARSYASSHECQRQSMVQWIVKRKQKGSFVKGRYRGTSECTLVSVLGHRPLNWLFWRGRFPPWRGSPKTARWRYWGVSPP